MVETDLANEAVSTNYQYPLAKVDYFNHLSVTFR